MGELEGKVVLITGGSRGMGEQMAHAFARKGASIIVASRKLDNCVKVADEISGRYGVRALPAAFNVSDWAQCDELIAAAYDAFGQVDVLINNAGLSPLYPSLDGVSEALFDKVIAVNLRGPFRLTAVIGTRMAASTGGTIINISSVEAIRPHVSALPYAAAKAGLNVLTEGFARAFGPKVRVNAIQCGAFLTDIAKNWDDGIQEDMEQAAALHRVATASEITGAALFFATSASSFATGAVLRLDGGVR
jgi:NAD(P)-dependent dehydrogenase (short-subunit alcohol dehydrogenase family)